MNGQRVGSALAWVAVVVVGAGASWYAIDRAGGEVSPGASVELIPSPSAVVDQQAPTATSPPSRRPTSTTTPAAPTRTPSSPTQSDVPENTPAPPAPAPTVRRTWSGAAGLVTATCTGSRLRFESAQPADGWQVERGDDGIVDVRFERGEQEIRVTARCSGGAPRFSVENDDD